MSKTLYERLGELNGISKIVDDAINLHMINPQVSPRFIPFKDEPERLSIIKQHSINFFCAGAGGPQTYGGKDMVTAHKGMNISEQEYLAVVDDILEALEKNNFGDDEKKDVLAILYSLKGGIMRM
jgi:hemoglobin